MTISAFTGIVKKKTKKMKMRISLQRIITKEDVLRPFTPLIVDAILSGNLLLKNHLNVKLDGLKTSLPVINLTSISFLHQSTRVE